MQFLTWIRRQLRGLVEVQWDSSKWITSEGLDDQIVQFAHETVRTFFLEGCRSGNLVLDRNEIMKGHATLLRACLNFISIADFDSTEDEDLSPGPYKTPFHYQKFFETGSQSDRLVYCGTPDRTSMMRLSYPFLDYAVRYLFYHFLLEVRDNTRQFTDVLSDRDFGLWKRWSFLTDKGYTIQTLLLTSTEVPYGACEIITDFVRRLIEKSPAPPVWSTSALISALEHMQRVGNSK
jgi:hypothetical protein